MVGSAMSPLIDGDLAIVHLPGAQSAIRCPDFEPSDQRGALVAYDAATGTERWRWEGATGLRTGRRSSRRSTARNRSSRSRSVTWWG